jgi:hypothetical protein
MVGAQAILSRRVCGVLALLVFLAASSLSLSAQSKIIAIRMLDCKTGSILAASNFQVRIDRQDAVHANWVTQNEDGTAVLKLPAAAALLSIHGTYDSAMQTYITCDYDPRSKVKVEPAEHWYPVSEILASGMVLPNLCAKPRDAARFKVVPKPGEFVFFVRKLNAKEQWMEGLPQ